MSYAIILVCESLILYYAAYHVGCVVPAVGTELSAVCREVSI